MTQPFVLDETAALLSLLASAEGPHLADMPPAMARDTYLQLGGWFDAQPDPAVRKRDFVGAGCALRAYFPEAVAQAAPAPGPVIVYFHGGGWVIGDLDTHDGLCALVAGVSGLRVVAVDYRPAPEHPYPAAHEDCLAAARFVAASPSELGAAVTGIAVAGDSAGGNLAFHVAATLGAEAVLAQMLLYPLLDSTSPAQGSYKDFGEGWLLDRRLMDRFLNDYLPDVARRGCRDASPLLHSVPAGMPPTVMLGAGLDMLRDQARGMAAQLVRLGVETHYIEATGLIHGLATMRKALPTSTRYIQRAVAAFAEILRVRQDT